MPTTPIAVEMQMLGDAVAAVHDRQEKISIIRQAWADRAHMIALSLMFNPSITFSKLPKGMPGGLKPEATGENEGYLKNFLLRQKYIYFIDGHNDTIRQPRLMGVYLNLLENSYPCDREFFVSIVNKTWPYGGVTYDLVREAFRDEFTGFWPPAEGTEAAEEPAPATPEPTPPEPHPAPSVTITESSAETPPTETPEVPAPPAKKAPAKKKASAKKAKVAA